MRATLDALLPAEREQPADAPLIEAAPDAGCAVARWAIDALTRRKGAHVSAKDLRAIFEAWCAERDLEPSNRRRSASP
jgi:hypothetical protein